MSKYICNYCYRSVDAFLPLSLKGGQLSNFIRSVEIVGSDPDKYLCEHCGSTDRERHLKQYLERIDLALKGKRVLHFSPERNFQRFIASLCPELHVLASYGSKDLRTLDIDIERIPFNDETFDLVIANHILEHVSSPEKAICEVNRVLKKDGLALLQTPYSATLCETFESDRINSDDLKLFYYGQEDHVRLFGVDIFNRLSTYMDSAVLRHADVFQDNQDPHGVNLSEPLFLFKKKFIKPCGETTASAYGELKATIAKRGSSGRPKVSVCCITFNQKRFVGRMIDGLISQQADFDVEIIIGDDRSTDGTYESLLQAAKSYPCINVLEQTQKLGAYENLYRTYSRCSGEYVAICEGDDYWLDPLKLHKQASFLDANPNYVVTYSAVQAVTDSGIDYGYVGGRTSDLTCEELTNAPGLNTLTAMFRRKYSEFPQEIRMALTPDLFVWSIHGQFGQGKFLASVLPSIYRIHSGGIHSSKSILEKILMRSTSFYALSCFYSRQGNRELAEHFLLRCISDIEFLKASSEKEIRSASEVIFERLDEVCAGARVYVQGYRALFGEVTNHLPTL